MRARDPVRSPHAAGRAAARTPWGDDFQMDGVAALWRVRHWEEVAPDEHALLFPRLVPSDGRLPPHLLARLASAVRVGGWRASRLVRGAPLRDGDARSEHADWHAPSTLPLALWRALGRGPAAPDVLLRDGRVLATLRAILEELDGGHLRPRSDEDEVILAFGAGFHPAYLWPEAACVPERGLTAAWLGHVARGRSALMPTSVAEHLLASGDATSDPSLTGVCGGGTLAPSLVRAARRRVAGDRVAYHASTVIPSPLALVGT